MLPRFKDSKQKIFNLFLRPTLAWKVIFSLICFLSLCLVAGLGKVLIVLFPTCSFVVGVYLYLRAPALYVGFVFWMWFLSPLIRRLIDYQSSYLTPGPWTFTALVVTFISFYTFLLELPKTNQKNNLPFILCFVALFYGLLTGLVQNPLDQAIVNFLSFLSPLSFGFHLYVNWKYYPQYRQVIQQSFLWGILTMGLYGILQFCTAPLWDQFWLNNAPSTSSFGVPEPFGIRVMSTMSSPQAFATTMMAGLILLSSNQKTVLFLPATVLGYLTFLLSQARAAWLSWGTGLFAFITSSKLSTQVKAIAGIALIVLIVLPLINQEPFSDIILSRFESLSNTENDISLNARSWAYQNLFDLAITEVVGKGLGFNINLPGFGNRDSTILPVLFVFGWVGATPLMCGICLLFFKMLHGKTNKSDTFSVAARGICLGVLTQIGFNSIFESLIGVIFWSFIGIYLAGQRYYLLKSKSLYKNE